MPGPCCETLAHMSTHQIRSKWAAVGAAVAVSLGAGGIGITQATTSSGERPIYLPIEPCRLADTRVDFRVGPRSAPLGPEETYTLSGQGAVGNCNLPAESTALSLNVTAIDTTAPTFVSLFPAGADLPVASHLNPLPGQGPVPNAVNVDLNAGGEFSIYNLAGNVNIFIDVVGIYDDHTHDDRYYQKSEVDELVTAGEAITGPGASLSADLVVQRKVVVETVTTATAGQLLVSKFGRFYLDCTEGARLYFIVVDDVPLRSSAYYVPDATWLNATLTGTTIDVIPAGDHEIAIGAQCYNPTTHTGGHGLTGFSSSSVTVIP